MPPPNQSRSPSLLKSLVAVTLHRPGLWLIYHERVSETIRRKNSIAALTVAVGTAATAIMVPRDCRLFAALTVWAVGHLAWGTYLAFAVR
jgi:hypothetical protein